MAYDQTSGNTLQGGEGDDQLYAGGWVKGQYAGLDDYGSETTTSNPAFKVSNSVFEGNAGDDTIYVRGQSQNNTIYGNDSMDAMAAATHEVASGETDNDVFNLYDNAENNALYGQGGNDRFELHTTNGLGNSLYGGTGDDTFVSVYREESGAYTAKSTLDGGDGNDTFLLFDHFGGDGGSRGVEYGNSVTGGAGDDIILFTTPRTYSTAAQFNTLSGGEGDDYIGISASGFKYNTVRGDEGNDVIAVSESAAFNTLDGGAGNDLFDATTGNTQWLNGSSYDGGSGLDMLLVADNNLDFSAARASTTNDYNQYALNNVEAIVIKGASKITENFSTDLTVETSIDDPNVYRGEFAAAIDPAARKMTQADVKGILEGMGLVWQDDPGDGSNIFQWQDKTGWERVGSRNINDNNYDIFTHSTGGEVDMKILIDALKNDWNG